MKTSDILSHEFKFFDIAANLCDEKFNGVYNDKKYHEDDTDKVIERALSHGVKKMLFAAGCLDDAHKSYNLSQKSSDFYITAGIHPCRTSEALKKNPEIKSIFEELDKIIDNYKDKIIAVGECGLDYDLLHYSNKEDQLKLFSPHFDLAQKYNLPVYLHSRNSEEDFYKIVKENRHKFNKGIVHSFSGTQEELEKYLSLDLYIGVTGCSFKTKENIECAKKIPVEKLMIETDSPYCEIRSTNEGFKLIETKFEGRVKKEKMKLGLMCKDRNEPCFIIQVLEVMSKLKNMKKKELAGICYSNSLKFFNIDN